MVRWATSLFIHLEIVRCQELNEFSRAECAWCMEAIPYPTNSFLIEPGGVSGGCRLWQDLLIAHLAQLKVVCCSGAVTGQAGLVQYFVSNTCTHINMVMTPVLLFPACRDWIWSTPTGVRHSDFAIPNKSLFWQKIVFKAKASYNLSLQCHVIRSYPWEDSCCSMEDFYNGSIK